MPNRLFAGSFQYHHLALNVLAVEFQFELESRIQRSLLLRIIKFAELHKSSSGTIVFVQKNHLRGTAQTSLYSKCGSFSRPSTPRAGSKFSQKLDIIYYPNGALPQEVLHGRRIEVPVESAKDVGFAQQRCLDHRIVVRIGQDDAPGGSGIDQLRQIAQNFYVLLHFSRCERPQGLHTRIRENSFHLRQ